LLLPSLTSALVNYALTAHWSLMVASGTLLGQVLASSMLAPTIANKQRNANLMGILHAFYGIGALLGPAIATTLLALGLDWRFIYLVFAGLWD